MTSNCLIFAIQEWFRCGGYIIFRASHYGWWFHVIWSKDLKHFEEFHPLGGKRKRFFPPLLFAGYVRHSDADGQTERPKER